MTSPQDALAAALHEVRYDDEREKTRPEWVYMSDEAEAAAILAALAAQGWEVRRAVPSVRESSARLGITMTEHNAPDIVHPAPFLDDAEDV